MPENLPRLSKKTGLAIGFGAGGLLAVAVLFFCDPTRSEKPCYRSTTLHIGWRWPISARKAALQISRQGWA